MITSGWIPMLRSSRTLCCVGFVFSSPVAPTYGRSVTWIESVPSRPSSLRIWRIASRNGWPSMSPTVPPTSTITTSAPVSRAMPRMRPLISFVTWGMGWIVPPRKSPRRSFASTDW